MVFEPFQDGIVLKSGFICNQQFQGRLFFIGRLDFHGIRSGIFVAYNGAQQKGAHIQETSLWLVNLPPQRTPTEIRPCEGLIGFL